MLFKDKRIFNSIDQTIGNTPMVRLKNLKKKFNLQGEIIAKLEFFNPLGSVKDRIGLAMIEAAEKKKTRFGKSKRMANPPYDAGIGVNK